jgi:hypothetical protein
MAQPKPKTPDQASLLEFPSCTHKLYNQPLDLWRSVAQNDARKDATSPDLDRPDPRMKHGQSHLEVLTSPPMDFPEPNGGSPGGFDSGWDEPREQPKKKPLPADLPRSLDDRRHVPTELVPETEMYDGWQGACLPPTRSLDFPAALPRNYLLDC